MLTKKNHLRFYSADWLFITSQKKNAICDIYFCGRHDQKYKCQMKMNDSGWITTDLLVLILQINTKKMNEMLCHTV